MQVCQANCNRDFLVKRHFYLLKHPAFVDALFVQKPERVDSLVYVLLFACSILSLLKRRVRRGPSLPTPARGAVARPTRQETLDHPQPLIGTPVGALTRGPFALVIYAPR